MSKVLTTEELDALEKSSNTQEFTTEQLDAMEKGQEFKPGGAEANPIAYTYNGVPQTASKAPTGATGQWEPPPSTSILDKAKSYLLPSWRTASQVAGAAVGGAATGPLGIIPGASIGESIYQLGQQATGDPNAPQTPQESALEHASAMGSAMIGEALPLLARFHGEHPAIPAIKDALSRAGRGLFTSSETMMTRGLNPSDKMFQQHVGRGLDELKEAERVVGPIKDVKTAQKGLEGRTSYYNNEIKSKIVRPQATIKVPGSGQKMIDDQIASIPEDIKMHEPQKYDRMVRNIQSAHPGDYTIGELDNLRSELSATQSSYYGKDVSGQLTMDNGTRATDIARGRSARAQFYHGLDAYGLGGGQQAAEANRRIGSIIHYQDALQDQVNASVAEKLPPFRRMTNKIKSPFSVSGVDNNIAKAVERWDKKPEPIEFTLEPRVSGTVGSQRDLLPTGGGPLLDQPAQTSSGIGDSWVAQQAAMKAQRGAPPPTTAGTQQGLPQFPGPLGQETIGSRAVYDSPEEQYLDLMRQRKMWKKGLPKSDREIPLPKRGQQDLQKGLAPNMFGIKQQTSEAIPPGTKLAFKSKMLDGTEMYHYETPDGRIIDLDHELTPAFTKTPTPKPYEPGTSHAGNPHKEPTPPPRLKTKRKL